MGNVKLNYRRIAERVAKSPAGATKIENNARAKFEIAKGEFLKDFLDHSVTKDLAAGYRNPSADIDSAGVMNGGGNLYSFLGLEYSKGDPISPVYEKLKETTVMTITNRQGLVVNGKPTIRMFINLRTDRPQLFEMTRLVWDNGLSWLYNISTGISGLSHYLSGRFKTPPSFSTGGLQIERETRSGGDVKIPYINKLFDGLKQRCRALGIKIR